MRRTIGASEFGAYPGIHCHQQLTAALQYLNAIGGGCLEIDSDGEYLVGGSVGLSGFSSHIRIENKAGGTIKADVGLSGPVLRFISGGKLTLHGVRVDNSQGSTQIGTAGCTGLEIGCLDEVFSDGYHCYGGEETTNIRSDSGVSTVATRVAIFNNSVIRGQGDAAFYPNWDNSGTVDGYFEVNGGRYSRCKQVLTAKRNLKEVIWNGGYIEECEGGLSTQWVTAGSEFIHPARYLMVDGAKFKKVKAGCVHFKGDVKGGARNITVEDVGNDCDGTNNAAHNAVAISVQGASCLKFSNLSFAMRGWPSAQEIAFRFMNDTTDGTLVQGGHTVRGIDLDNWFRYATGGNDGKPSIHDCVVLGGGVVTPFVASNFHTASPVHHRFMTTPAVKRVWLNGASSVE